MSLVVFEGVELAFGARPILDGVDLRLGSHDRIGLVGPNGSGKTTLLKLLANSAQPDGGTIRRRRDMRIGYLPQHIDVDGGISVQEMVRASVPGREGLETELTRAEAELAALAEAARPEDGDAMMELAEEVGDLHEQLANFEVRYSTHEAAKILAGLGFRDEDLGRDVAELSGGWRMRVVLASLLFQQPDLLLLDEPTNHLDLPSVAWLAGFLQRYGAAFVLVCHDREFLNEQVRRIVSFEVEGVRAYEGDYEHYRKQRAEEEEVLRNKAKNLTREREQAKRFVDRFRAQASKAKAVKSREKALLRMEEVAVLEDHEAMQFRFPPVQRAGNTVLTVEHLRKAYGEHVVLGDVSLHVPRGSKIGIIGVNGAGKTTLLRAVAGEIPIEAGRVGLGHNVTVGYYAQHHTETLSESNTILDELRLADESASATRLRQVAGAFLFRGDEVDKQIAVLSGGERARVALARLLLRPGNLLLMDEPTNHLDLDSSERLAEALSAYDGTLIFVSHNRAFVRRLATKIWDVADGGVQDYPGGLDDYLARHQGEGAAKEPAAVPRKLAPDNKPAPARPAAPSRRSRADEKARKRDEASRRKEAQRTLGPLKKEVAQLEARIEELEAEQKERSLLLADEALYADAARRNQVLTAYQETADKLEELTDRWELKTAQLEGAEATS